MADIQMCTGNGCPMKVSCYRHQAPQNPYRQSWMMIVPYVPAANPNEIGKCEYYDPMEACHG